MNSYGDPQSARARARVPGPSAASTPDDDQSGPRYAAEGRPAPDAYRRSGGGSAPRGAASVGSASVGSGGRASVGSASAGRASVGAASVGAARVGGRASVGEGTGTHGGRAAVARASVRPTPSYDELGDPTPVSPAGGGGKDKSKAAKRRRRANILTAMAAVVVILLGAGVVAGTWFFDGVEFNEPTAEGQVTQLVASDGKKTIATLGEQNRSVVPYQSINPIIGQAVIAAEDKNFYDHNGIDMKGIARAAWNNFTGGSKQGASTITQQYARHAAELKEISYNRKLREAVIARKMEDKYEKPEILGRYLNSVYFGRGAYGIEAAVKAYFGTNRSATVQPGQKGAVTAAEAAVLASVIRQPEPSNTTKGYDPQNDLEAAKQRWGYTLSNMIEKGWLTEATKPTTYPKVREFNPSACRTTCGNDKPTGKIVKYVKQELLAMGIKQEELNKGGLKITTTIDADVQKAAETAAARTSKESPLSKLSSTYKSALVAVDPENGRVLAYYGGPEGDGVGWDYAGPNYTKSGSFMGGGRPPGSSAKIYTLLAGVSAGYGFNTTWDAKKLKANGEKINNSGRTSFACDERRCELDKATVESYNFPFYWLADMLGPDKVLEAYHKAGVQYVASPTKIGSRIDLGKASEKQLRQYGQEVAIGQYAITVLDHANGVATLAADGTYNKAHFVRKVEKRDDKTGKFKPFHNEKLKPKTAFDKNVIAAIDHVLQKVPGANSKNLDGGRPAIAKTGTWEYQDGKTGENGDAWMVGATRQIAAAVWIGREKAQKNGQMKLLPIKQANGDGMNGGSTPGEVWKMFMDLAHKNMESKEFLPNVDVGDPNKKGNGLEPEPEVETPPDVCNIPGFCGDGNGNNNNGGGNGGPGNGGPGNGGPGNGGPGNGNGNGDQDDGQGDTPPDPNQGGDQETLPGFPPNNTDGTGGTGTGGGQNTPDQDD
ncbi:transglycosylase domain-containing protein [Jidongwangia harbinensis]|uniref:transglycosylase domain-containing protein n=1 Tax=Jidongwangia harbinensis TaxID=2878561 RepID=UPI001CD9ACB2|nr:transglycosylase domain-containing protein [Jidongwangia harbinensis]MCA2212712.1 transglycosylase domain-containing protein [Jidongwangia harbinensis]